MRRITNIRLPQAAPQADLKQIWGICLDKSNQIVEIYPLTKGTDFQGEDWGGDWLSPMAIDLQMNGGLGLSFNKLSSKNLPELISLLDLLWLEGIEAICPTLVTCEFKQLRQALSVLKKCRKYSAPKRCKLLGAHLEGPFISATYRGAHPKEHLCEPTLKALESRINGFEKEISLFTLAPELSGSEEIIKNLKSLGIVVCLGHSSASGTACKQFFEQGLTMLTHTFNAMPGLHHRAPGPIGEAIKNGEIALGLIADGKHVDPTMAMLLQRLSPKKIVLVSDALSPYGMSKGPFRWDERELIVEKGTCYLKDGTLVGTTLPLLEGCKRLAKWTGNPSAAIWSATISPRQVLAEKKSIESYLLNQPLTKLLRWQGNLDGGCLKWSHAA